MESLPQELLHKVYALSTPNRKRALLATSTSVAAQVRAGITKCATLQPLAVLPSTKRFGNLKEVFLMCDPDSARDMLGGITRFWPREKHVVIYFRSVEAYGRHTASCLCEVKAVSFDVDSGGDAAHAAKVLQKCRGLSRANFSADACSGISLPRLTNPSVACLRLRNLAPSLLHMQSLRHLAIIVDVIDITPSLLDALPQLEDLDVTTGRLLTAALSLPRTITALQLRCTGQSATIQLVQLSSLVVLRLHNIVTDITLPPVLELLVLSNTTTHIPASAILRHPPLVRFTYVRHNPPPASIAFWREQMRIHRARGWCTTYTITLFFTLRHD